MSSCNCRMNPHRMRHLTRAMQRAANLSPLEARSAIRMWRLGYQFSGEAVNHYGGIERVLQDAIRTRHQWNRPTWLNDIIEGRL
jgi:hypothetical protein